MKKVKILLLVIILAMVLTGCKATGGIDSFGDKASSFVKDGITLINDNLTNEEEIVDEDMSKVDKFLYSTFGTTLIEMAIQLCATLIIFLIVRFLIWNKVTEILETRKKMVRDAINERDKALEDAKLALDDAKITKENAQKEASHIIENAKKRGYNEASAIVDAANEKASLKISNANEEIERMNNENIASVKKQIVEVAYAMAEKIVEKEIKEEKYDFNVDDFLKEDKNE